MVLKKGHGPIEPDIKRSDMERIWELFFGEKWGLDRIAQDYGVKSVKVANALDRESERRWRTNHPYATNRQRE